MRLPDDHSDFTGYDLIEHLPTTFPAVVICLGGLPFLAVYDSGDGLRIMEPPLSPRAKAAMAGAEKRFGANRKRFADRIVANPSANRVKSHPKKQKAA